MKWLEENAPTASIRRAVGEGSVEFLGWFGEFSGSAYPGWVVQVTSTITGIIWNIVIRQTLYHPSSYFVWVLDGNVPWKYYNPGNSKNPFMQGDNSEKYLELRNAAIKNDS